MNELKFTTKINKFFKALINIQKLLNWKIIHDH